MPEHAATPAKKRRFAPLLLIAGLAGTILLSLSMTSTLSAFTAAITNTSNTAAAGTLILQESSVGGTVVTCNSTDAGSISVNSATCATINKYGGSTVMVPTNAGGTTNLVSTSITFKNTGTATAASFTLTPGVCTQSNNGTPNGTATDFCGKLNVSISANGTVFKTGSATSLAGTSIPVPVIPAPGGAVVSIVFVVSLDTSAGNTYQGLAASQPLTWTLST